MVKLSDECGVVRCGRPCPVGLELDVRFRLI